MAGVSTRKYGRVIGEIRKSAVSRETEASERVKLKECHLLVIYLDGTDAPLRSDSSTWA